MTNAFICDTIEVGKLVKGLPKGDIMNNTKKWVACWGYDQTQYSIYEEVSRKGQFVVVRGYNEWACLGEKDLYVGSKVKYYKPIKHYNDLSYGERLEFCEKMNWDKKAVSDSDEWQSFARWGNKNLLKQAPTRTITKVKHFTTDTGWRAWEWELDNGDTIKATDDYVVEIVDALTRRKITERWGDLTIKINDSIRARLDENFDKNVKTYEEQNGYTAYHGH